MTLIYLVTAWVAGILIASGHNSSWHGWLALAGCCLALAFLFRADRPKRLALVMLAAFALGVARQAWAQRPLPGTHLARYTDAGYQVFTGRVIRTPDVRDTHVNLTVSVEELKADGGSLRTTGLALVQAPRYGDYSYGDRVRVAGEMLTPPEFDTFSYRDYLARRGIYAIVPRARVDILERRGGIPWLQALYDLRDRAHDAIGRLLPSPQAPLLAGILLGLDIELPETTRQAFNRTGTAHIIAISGANVIIVVKVLLNLLTPLAGIRRARLFTVGGVLAYMLFVGADPTVVRAAIMGCLVLFAAQSGRKAHGLTSLAFAVWAMSVWNPALLWEVGFQLSVAATGGLVLFGDTFTRGLEHFLQRLLTREVAHRAAIWLSEPIAISLAAQVATTPLAMLYFGQLSLVALLANALIVPAQPYIMIFGWLAVVVGLFLAPLGWLVSWSVWLPLTYTLQVVRVLSRLPWAAIEVNLSSSAVWGFYAVFFGAGWLRLLHPEDRAWLLRRARRHLSAATLMLVTALVCVAVWYVALTQPDGRLHVWFLGVGHGHAVLIQTPRGAHILIGGGPNPNRLRQEVGDALPAWDRTLDLVIVPQFTAAAAGALPALLDHYGVSLVASSGQMASDGVSQALSTRLAKRHVSQVTLVAGQRIETSDGVVFEILYPPEPPGPEDTPEDTGLVVRILYGDASFLVTPQLSADAVEALLASGRYLGSTVAVLPSFGAEKANPPDFLAALSPQVTVVMAERAGFPAAETLTRLQGLGPIAFYRTDRQGTVEMVVQGRELRIYSGAE